MAEPRLTEMRIAILATDGFEQSELLEPREALDDAEAITAVLAPHSGTIQGMNHDSKADTVTVDMTLDEADPDAFDAVVLPGGAFNADALRIEPKAQAFVKAIDGQQKPIAVICHGPWLLISAGLVRGRTLTSYHTIQDDIKNAGGNWLDHEVVRDGNWVSSRKPQDIPAFNREMKSVFAAHREKSQHHAA